MSRCWWFGVVAALLCGSAHAQSWPAAGQTADEVRAVLLAWDWEGDWFQDCDHMETGGHFVASLGDGEFPRATLFYNGAQASEGRLISARVESDGKLVTVTESQIGNFLTNRVTTVEMARENSFQVSSLEADSEAIADVPQHLFPLKPEGMARGTHVHTAVVRDWMILDPLEKPVRPTTVYYRCGGRLS